MEERGLDRDGVAEGHQSPPISTWAPEVPFEASQLRDNGSARGLADASDRDYERHEPRRRSGGDTGTLCPVRFNDIALGVRP